MMVIVCKNKGEIAMIAAIEERQIRKHKNHPRQEKQALKKNIANNSDNAPIYSWDYIDEQSYANSHVRWVLVNDRWYIFTF